MNAAWLVTLIAVFMVSCGDQPDSGSHYDIWIEPPFDVGPYDSNQPDIPVWEPGEYVVDCTADGMCFVPAGPFWMGCDSDLDYYCAWGESPRHEVTLSAYYIDKTEVTQAAYAMCVDAGTCRQPGSDGYTCKWEDSSKGNHPANCMTYEMAETYCAWAGKRLPTEAEWEKAARGTDWRTYPWGNERTSCDYAVLNRVECIPEGTREVCSKSPAGDSPYGLCDMAGNVMEWVSDWYAPDYYSVTPLIDPTGPSTGDNKGCRGGAFGETSMFARSSCRTKRGPIMGTAYEGFRCVSSSVE